MCLNYEHLSIKEVSMRFIRALIVGAIMISGIGANASNNCESRNLDSAATRLSEQYYKLGHNYVDSAMSCAREVKKPNESEDEKHKKCLLKLVNGYSALLLSSALGRTSYEIEDGEKENIRFTLSKLKTIMGPYVAQSALEHAIKICKNTKGGWCESNCIPEIN